MINFSLSKVSLSCDSRPITYCLHNSINCSILELLANEDSASGMRLLWTCTTKAATAAAHCNRSHSEFGSSNIHFCVVLLVHLDPRFEEEIEWKLETKYKLYFFKNQKRKPKLKADRKEEKFGNGWQESRGQRDSAWTKECSSLKSKGFVTLCPWRQQFFRTLLDDNGELSGCYIYNSLKLCYCSSSG